MLAQEQLHRFYTDGYLVSPGLVPEAALRNARQEIAWQLERQPLPDGHRGPHMMFLRDELPQPLTAPLLDTPALAAAESLIGPARFEAPDQVQISLNVPPFPHRPGGPHVDGINPPEEDGRPGTFTLLAGTFLTDQSHEEMGNLWVWPGSHLTAAAYFREHGPETLLTSAPYPPVALAEPRQVTGRAGDLLLTHYLLGHNLGGNTSDTTREVLYYRLRARGHRRRWRDCVQKPFFEFPIIRVSFANFVQADLDQAQ